MKRLALPVFAVILASAATMFAQDNAPDPETTLRINSRAVLVDVIVTDHNGNPVTGLDKDAFSLTEQGASQPLTYFEEHRGLTPEQARSIQFPQLPPDVFTNFSPIGRPPAVNILLLDALNTPMSDQAYLRQAAQHYLKTLKPGSRLAIFTLGLQIGRASCRER